MLTCTQDINRISSEKSEDIRNIVANAKTLEGMERTARLYFLSVVLINFNF